MKFSADILFTPTLEGGMQDQYFSGMKPSFNIDGQLIMCSFEVADGSKVIKSGEIRSVVIELPHYQLVAKYLKVGAKFKLNSGGRVLGSGTITAL
jgi:translation elongation factor EF-Tu-like GTPase